jgi:osmoprotectant transport system permease protein
MVWSWIPQNWSLIWQYTLDNLLLGLIPPLIGLAVSLPLGIACVRWRLLYPPALGLASAIYALPSLALFVVLIDYTGLGNLTVIIPLALFSLCILLPAVVDGLRGVPEPVRQAATAMGYGELRRLATVELPLAIPVVNAGLRIAVVSSISLASVGQLIGVSSLGYFFIDGFQRDFPTEIYVSIALIIVLALLCDLVLVGAGRLLTPWQRNRTRTSPRLAIAPEVWPGQA